MTNATARNGALSAVRSRLRDTRARVTSARMYRQMAALEPWATDGARLVVGPANSAGQADAWARAAATHLDSVESRSIMVVRSTSPGFPRR